MGTKPNISVVPIPGYNGPEVVGIYTGNVGKMAQAYEVGAAIGLLASDLTSDSTGVVLPMDGGWSAV